MPVDLYQKYGLSEKEVTEWAKTKYPQFLKNKTVLAQLYLKQVRKVQLTDEDIAIMRGPVKKINELKPGQWVIIEAVVGPKLRENSYNGCPICFKKLEGEFCEICGKVEPIVCWFDSYVVGDNTGDIIATFGPKLANSRKSFEGTVLRLRGVLGDQGEFLVNAIEPLEEGRKELVEKKAEVDAQAEVNLVKEIFEKFPVLRYEDLQKWHSSRGLSTNLDELLAKAPLFKWPDGTVRKEAPTSTSPVAPQLLLIQEEVEKMKKVLEMFPEVDLDSLKIYYTQEKFKTPLEALLKAAGGVIDDKGKVRKVS